MNLQSVILPQAVIWSSFNAATQIIRESAVPAYTNNRRMVMTPDLAVWKELYLYQLMDYECSQQTQANRKVTIILYLKISSYRL